jgi:Fe-coproporphyrin III synthase
VEGGSALQPKTDSLTPVKLPAHDAHTLQTLPILVVHAHSSCNCRCIMCDIWKNRENKIFGTRDLIPQLGSIRKLGVRWIVFSGGEPLMNPELPQLCAILREEGIHLTLLTTGLLLKKCATTVAYAFDDVIVSLDGPPAVHNAIRRVPAAFELLEAGVCALREARPDMRITARSTIQKANHNCLMETARTAKLLALNGISFLAVDLTSQAFNRELAWPVNRQAEIGLSLSELAELENEVELLIRNGDREFGPGFIAESPAKLSRIIRHFRAQFGLDSAEAPPCNAPWVSAVIEADGQVRPCFFHRPIGNLRNLSLEQVINGEEALAFRRDLDIPTNSICKNCVCSLNYRASVEGVGHEDELSSPEYIAGSPKLPAVGR